MRIVQLDAILHQPVRTQLVAYLAARGEATFSELKRVLGLTDGNLDAHVRKLIDAEYLIVRKETGSGRPQTVYALTKVGNKALATYISHLSKLLELGAAASNLPARSKPSTT